MRTNNKPSNSSATFHGGNSRSTDPWKDGVCGKCGASCVDRQIGLEPTPDEFVTALVEVFRSVRRVLRDDGTVWLNLGDSYAGGPVNGAARPGAGRADGIVDDRAQRNRNGVGAVEGAKPKDLIGIPWMVAFALRKDGWYLRSDIIWAKPNPMPESVTDRPTKSHEYLFLLSKGPRYFYDADAIREEHTTADRNGQRVSYPAGSSSAHNLDTGGHVVGRHGPGLPLNAAGRNRRSVWTVATQPYPGAHFATFPPKLIEPCILAGTSEKACGVCGAPWQRVVERDTRPPDERPTNKPIRRLAVSDAGQGTNGTGESTLGMVGDVTTIGWEPSCDHQDDTGTSVVLDPFSGAGTTGIVALRHDRSYVGCELNPEYVEMSRHRIVDDAPLLNSGIEVPEGAISVHRG